jgi:hypothetical protein
MKARIENNDGIGLEVELEGIGEGYGGEHDPHDPLDLPLLRMDVTVTQAAADRFELIGEEGGEGWFVPDKLSYCTRIPERTPDKVVGKLAAEMAAVLWRVLLNGGNGLKHYAAQLSWTDDRGLPTEVL